MTTNIIDLGNRAVTFLNNYLDVSSTLYNEESPNISKVTEITGRFLIGSRFIDVVSEEGLPGLVDAIFSISAVKDFVFDLQFHLFSVIPSEDIPVIIGQLANGIAPLYDQLKGTKQPSAIPDDTPALLNTNIIIEQRLHANRWLVGLLLLGLGDENGTNKTSSQPR